MPREKRGVGRCVGVREVRLFWLRFVKRNFDEAEGMYYQSGDGDHAKEMAKLWLLGKQAPKHDLELVCAWAGLDASRVVEEAERRWPQWKRR